MTVLVTALAGLILVSLFEYFGHRSVLHEGRLSLGKDHIVHHKYFARDFHAPDETPVFYDRYWFRGLFGALWTLPLTVALAVWVGWASAATLLAVAVWHAVFWQWIHNEMHRPQTAWLQKTRYFRFVRDFHLGHHQKSRTNYAFVFAPVWDFVFGTYRRAEKP